MEDDLALNTRAKAAPVALTATLKTLLSVLLSVASAVGVQTANRAWRLADAFGYLSASASRALSVGDAGGQRSQPKKSPVVRCRQIHGRPLKNDPRSRIVGDLH